MIKEGIKAYKFAKTFKKYKSADSEAERIKAAKLLSKIFSEEGGLLLKVAQYMGTEKDQAEQIQELSLKNESVLSHDLFIELVEETIGKDISEICEEVFTTPFSASIGQVQQGRLKDGSEIALKVQYPFIADKLQQQLKLLNLIPTGVPEKKWGVDIESYKQMIKNLLDKELDYNHERQLQELTKEALGEYDFIKIPKVYNELSTKNLLVTEYIHGLTVQDIKLLSDKDRREFAQNLLKTFLLMIYKGQFQADSNHGNFLFLKPKHQIVLIDFGQFKVLDENFSKSLLSLIYALITEKEIDYASFIVALGFSEKKMIKIQSSIGVLAKVLFEPFLKNYPYDLSDWEYKRKIDLSLGEDKWWFRSAGGEDFFLLMKSFMGVKNLIAKLDVNINWRQCFEVLIPLFDKDYLNYEPPKANILRSPGLMGSAVSVKLTEAGVDKVHLRLGIGVLYDFRDTIGEEIVCKLESEGIDVEKIAQEALKSGAMPMKLFEFNDEKKEIVVEII
jgi:aarF domain-containing kinase